MVRRGTSGQSTTEFIMVLGVLTAIGYFMMNQLTNQGNNAIGVGEQAAVTAIQND